MPANRRYRFYRIHPSTGARIPCIMELDENLTFIAEYSDASASPPAAADTATRQSQHVVARWSTPAISENPIEGTDALRKQFLDERDALIKHHEGLGVPCPTCDLGAIIRKYRVLLKKGGFLG